MENRKHLTKVLVACGMLCTLALFADTFLEFICKVMPSLDNHIMYILFDEFVHFLLAVLSWMCVLHWLKYKGFLSYVWEPSGGNGFDGNVVTTSSLPTVVKDYLFAGFCSCVVDFDHFLGLPSSDSSFFIRSFHGATHMSHRGFAHSLLFLLLLTQLLVVMCFLIVTGISHRGNPSSARKGSFTSTSFHPGKKLMLFNSRPKSTSISQSFAASGLTLPKRQYKLSPLYGFSMSIKYVSLILLSMLTHQLRDSKRRGLYLFYLPKFLSTTAEGTTGLSWTATITGYIYSITGTPSGSLYISTPPLHSFIYLLLTVLVPMTLSQIMILFCGAMHLMAKAEKEEDGVEGTPLLEDEESNAREYPDVKRKYVFDI